MKWSEATEFKLMRNTADYGWQDIAVFHTEDAAKAALLALSEADSHHIGMLQIKRTTYIEAEE